MLVFVLWSLDVAYVAHTLLIYNRESLNLSINTSYEMYNNHWHSIVCRLYGYNWFDYILLYICDQ